MDNKLLQIELSSEGIIWIGISLVFMIAFFLKKVYVEIFSLKDNDEKKRMYERLTAVEKSLNKND